MWKQVYLHVTYHVTSDVYVWFIPHTECFFFSVKQVSNCQLELVYVTSCTETRKS